MSDLIIILGEHINQAWEWRLTSTGEAGRAETDAEKSTLKTKDYRRIFAVIPGQQVVTKMYSLGNLSDKQKRQAVGFSVEDELASSLEDSHIVLENDSRMAIIARHVMDSYVADLATHRLSADIICADYDSFASADSFSYMGRIIQRTANGLGCAFETNIAANVLDTGQTIPPPIDSELFLQKIASAFAAGHNPINLRQGQFSKNNVNINGFAGFKRSAILAAAILVVFSGTSLFQGLDAERKTSALEEQINEVYVDIFPNTDIPDNPVRAIMQAQADVKSNNKQDFIKLSALLAQSIRDVKGVELSSLRYDAAKGQLSLSVNYSSFGDVEKIRTAVSNSGGIFAENSTRQNGEGLTGDVVLRFKPW